MRLSMKPRPLSAAAPPRRSRILSQLGRIMLTNTLETIRRWLTDMNDFCDFWNYQSGHDVFGQEMKNATDLQEGKRH